MKKRFFFIIMIFNLVGHINGQKIFDNNDSSLSNFIQKNFFSAYFNDTCYMGIHFITIEPQKNGVFNIQISGGLYHIYRQRIETLILSSMNIWNKNFIDDCVKNKKSIVQPVLFDIKTNCTNKLNEFVIDSSLHSFNKEAIFETSTKLLVQRNLLLIESFKNLSPQNNQYLNCILLSPCYIGSRPLKKKWEM